MFQSTLLTNKTWRPKQSASDWQQKIPQLSIVFCLQLTIPNQCTFMFISTKVEVLFAHDKQYETIHDCFIQFQLFYVLITEIDCIDQPWAPTWLQTRTQGMDYKEITILSPWRHRLVQLKELLPRNQEQMSIVYA